MVRYRSCLLLTACLVLTLPVRGAPPARNDFYGDPLPPHVLARLGTARMQHQSNVVSVALSPDGKLAASAGSDNFIRLWNPATGKVVRRIKGHRNWVLAVAFAPDSKAVASGGDDGVVRLWDVATGRLVRGLADKPAAPGAATYFDVTHAVAFSPDGKVLASGGQVGFITLHDVRTGRRLRRFGAARGVHGLAFSPDGKMVASADEDKCVRLWDPATGKAVRRLEGHTDVVLCVAFAPGGKLLASGSRDGSVRLWDPASGKELRRLTGHTHYVGGVVFLAGGKRLASAGWDATIRLWDTATGKDVRRLDGHLSWVQAIAASADSRTLFSGGNDNTVRFWDVATGKERFPTSGHHTAVTTVAFAPDGKTVASGGSDRRVRLWDAATGRERRVLTGHVGGPFSVAYSPDGRLLASAGWRTVRLWDTATGKLRRQCVGHSAMVTAVAFMPDGKALASGSADRTLRLWDVATGKEKSRWVVRPRPGAGADTVRTLSIEPSGRLIASAGDPRIYLWAERSNEPYHVMEVAFTQVFALAFSPDGKALAAGDSGGIVHLWEAASGKERAHFKAHAWVLDGLAFAPDSRSLATCGRESVKADEPDNPIRLWDLTTGVRRRELRAPGHFALCLAVAADGRLATGARDGTVLIWDTARLLRGPAASAAGLSAADLKKLWDRLDGPDAAAAWRAIVRLAGAPDDAAPFLRERLRPPAPVGRVGGLIANLDSDSFEVREKASQELERLGAAAGPALQEARSGRLSLEARRRVDELLRKLGDKATGLVSGELRRLRAIEALEHMGTPTARRALEALAKAAPKSPAGRAAKASLARLARRP